MHSRLQNAGALEPPKVAGGRRPAQATQGREGPPRPHGREGPPRPHRGEKEPGGSLERRERRWASCHSLPPAHHRGSLSPWGAGRGCVRWMFQEDISAGGVEQGLWASGGHRDSGGITRVLLQSREGDLVEKDILEWESTGFGVGRPLGELGRAGLVSPRSGRWWKSAPCPPGLPASSAGRLPSARGASPSALIVAPACPRQSALMNRAGCESCLVCASNKVPKAPVTVCQRLGASTADSHHLKAGKSKVKVPAVGFGESPLAALQTAALAASSRGGEEVCSCLLEGH